MRTLLQQYGGPLAEIAVYFFFVSHATALRDPANPTGPGGGSCIGDPADAGQRLSGKSWAKAWARADPERAAVPLGRGSLSVPSRRRADAMRDAARRRCESLAVKAGTGEPLPARAAARRAWSLLLD